MASNDLVGIEQAAYTWATRLADGRNGFGFAEVTPALSESLPWVESVTKGLCGFTGSSTPVADRRGFKPFGRVLRGRTAVCYRKSDGGLDTFERPGRYFIHFVLADANRIPLSAFLRIAPEWWLSGLDIPVDGAIALPSSISVIEAASMPVTLDCDDSLLANAKDAVQQIEKDGSADISQWSTEETIGFLGLMPRWFDVQCEIVHETSRGKLRTSITLRSAAVEWSGVSPFEFREQRLKETRASLSDAANVADCADRLLGRSKRVPAKPAEPDEELAAAVHEWCTTDEWRLTPEVSGRLSSQPARVLERLALDSLALPIGLRVSELTRLVSGGVPVDQWALLSSVLPADDRAVERLAASLPTAAVLVAVFDLNRSRQVELRFRTEPDSDTVQLAVARALDDPELYAGLVKTLKLSGVRVGLYPLLTQASLVPDELLFGYLAVDAFGEDAESLLGAIAAVPARFVDWVGVPEPYDRLVSELVGEEAHHALWHRWRVRWFRLGSRGESGPT